jgi:hypothetical protein
MKKCREFKRWIGKDYDFGYLLKMEQHKFRRMAKYFNKSRLTVDWEDQVRTCNLCDKLISIILAEDPYYKSWLHASYGGSKHEEVPFPVHINTRNWFRFMEHKPESKESKIYVSRCTSYRIVKALYLYNKIRNYKMFSLWD